MKNSRATGILYFGVHFVVEVSSFYVLTLYTDSRFVWLIMFIYDFAAFVPQGFFGYLRDKGIRINFALIGTVLTTLALVFTGFSLDGFLVVPVLSVGNCLVHIHGAELTLRSSPGRTTPAAVFVSGGSFGLITGKLMAMNSMPVVYVIGINLLSIIPILLAERLGDSDGLENLAQYRFASSRINPYGIIALATFVVAVRAFMGYGIPTSWNKTVLQTIMLYCAMGAGKALGGFLTDRIGIRKTALFSTLVSLPFLLAGSEIMTVSLIGIMLFSMTMAVTLAVLVSVLQRYPGVAFGFSTLGLFAGTVPMFFFRIRSFFVNAVIIAVMTVLCAMILAFICADKSKKERS